MLALDDDLEVYAFVDSSVGATHRFVAMIQCRIGLNKRSVYPRTNTSSLWLHHKRGMAPAGESSGIRSSFEGILSNSLRRKRLLSRLAIPLATLRDCRILFQWQRPLRHDEVFPSKWGIFLAGFR